MQTQQTSPSNSSTGSSVNKAGASAPAGTQNFQRGREQLAGYERNTESTIGLLHRLIEKVSTLFRQEIALARAELAESLWSAKAGVTSIATGGVLLFSGLLALLAAAVLALAEVLPAWLAALIVGVVVGIVGYLLLQAGGRKLDPSVLTPRRTPASLRRDAEVLTRRNE